MPNFLIISRRHVNFILGFSFLFLIAFGFAPVGAADDTLPHKIPTHSIADTSHFSQVHKVTSEGTRDPSLQTQNVRSRLSSFRSQPDSKKPRRRVGASYDNTPQAKSLKHRTDEVKIWLELEKKVPRQIKLKAASKKQGKVLMDAVSGNYSKRERDKKTSQHFLRANRALMRIHDSDKELVLSRYKEDTFGKRHLRYQQKYKGIPVWLAGRRCQPLI